MCNFKVVLGGYPRCTDSHDLSECHHLYDLGRHSCIKGTSGEPRHCIWTPDCPLKLFHYPALDSAHMTSEIVCFHRCWNSAYPTPRCPLKATPDCQISSPSYQVNSLNFDSEKMSVITPYDHLKCSCLSKPGKNPCADLGTSRTNYID